ncbi:MAG: Gfo/Idh/MocA family oxidoreductase [Firmicutes bacterium]|nr:Gfo/Idh/MocA family oxidoreductase [Bacillota bacterium]
MKLAILGVAHVHAKGYAQICKQLGDVEVARVYDRDAEAARLVADVCDAQPTQDVSACLGPEIDAVLICSENIYHSTLVRLAAAAGKHILCEKPLATSAQEAKEMVAVCKEAGVQLQTAFPCRYHPTITRTREVLAEGVLGDILAVRASNHGQMPGGWFASQALAGGGAIMDHTVHVVDLLRYLLDDEFASVYALSAHRFHDIEVEDAGLLSLHMQKGVMVTLDPSWSRPASNPTWGDVTMEFVGTNGTLSVDVFAQVVEWYRTAVPTYQWAPYGADMDALMLADFIERVRAQQTVRVTGVDGLRATEVVMAAYASVASGTVQPVLQETL